MPKAKKGSPVFRKEGRAPEKGDGPALPPMDQANGLSASAVMCPLGRVYLLVVPFQAMPPRSTFDVATFNLWNRCGPWEERLAAIRSQLDVLRPDVIALQEVVRLDGFDQAALLCNPHLTHASFGKNDRSDYPMGNAILSRWPIRKSIVFPLPNGGTDEHRSLLFSEIEAPFGTLPVFTTHLNWRLDEGHVREEQIRFVVDVITSHVASNEFPPLLMGDMNAEPDSDEMRFLRGLTRLNGKSTYFSDCFLISGDGTPGATFARRNPFAAPLREPDRRIDYIFVRGPDEGGRGEPLRSSVCFNEPHRDVFASDHFGVVATISTG